MYKTIQRNLMMINNTCFPIICNWRLLGIKLNKLIIAILTFICSRKAIAHYIHHHCLHEKSLKKNFTWMQCKVISYIKLLKLLWNMYKMENILLSIMIWYTPKQNIYGLSKMWILILLNISKTQDYIFFFKLTMNMLIQRIYEMIKNFQNARQFPCQSNSWSPDNIKQYINDPMREWEVECMLNVRVHPSL